MLSFIRKKCSHLHSGMTFWPCFYDPLLIMPHFKVKISQISIPCRSRLHQSEANRLLVVSSLHSTCTREKKGGGVEEARTHINEWVQLLQVCLNGWGGGPGLESRELSFLVGFNIEPLSLWSLWTLQYQASSQQCCEWPELRCPLALCTLPPACKLALGVFKLSSLHVPEMGCSASSISMGSVINWFSYIIFIRFSYPCLATLLENLGCSLVP